MAIDIDTMAPQAREYYLGVGRRYVTPHVVAQGEKTLRALARHAAVLEEQGFGADDVQDLVDGVDALRRHDTDRAQAAGSRKIIVQTSTDAVRRAKQWRKSARSILSAVLRVLRQTGDEARIRPVQTVLRETRILGDELNLPRHMDMLQAVLVDPALTAMVSRRGGLLAQANYQIIHPVLVEALGDLAAQPAVTAAAERRDILDGVVVTLCRSARTAAKLAARALGQPSLAAEFALTHLKPGRTGTSPEAPDAPEAPQAPGSLPGEPPATGIGDGTP